MYEANQTENFTSIFYDYTYILANSFWIITILIKEYRSSQITNNITWTGVLNLLPEKTELPEAKTISLESMNTFFESEDSIALFATFPKDNISLYGLITNGTEAGTYTLERICLKQNDVVEIYDIPWGVYGEIPVFTYYDFDNDGQLELAMIVRCSNGTDYNENNLFIFEKGENDVWTPQEYTSATWISDLNERLECNTVDETLTISLKNSTVKYEIPILKLQEEWGKLLTSVRFSTFGNFVFEHNKIYLETRPYAQVENRISPETIIDEDMRFEVQYDGGFSLK